jgi:hypothetical protein
VKKKAVTKVVTKLSLAVTFSWKFLENIDLQLVYEVTAFSGNNNINKKASP